MERDGRIGGLHRLRSTAICDAVHEHPPPVLADTIERVIPLVPTSQLHRFVATMLSNNPDARNVVIDAACGDSLEVDRVAAYLQGLRLADSRERALVWNEIAEQHAIPIAIRPMLFLFAVGGTEPPTLLPAEVKEAWDDMVAATGRTSRDDLITAVGLREVARLLASTNDIAKATQLLAVLAGVGSEFATAVSEAIAEQPTLVSALREAPLDALADCVATAHDADPSLARALVENIGGETAVIERIRSDNPWITRLEISEGDGRPVGLARLLHFPNDLQGDPDEQAHSLGRTLLRCLPRIRSVDVQCLLPGGNELSMAGYVRGVSRITRENDRSEPDAAWVQAQTRIAVALTAEADTARLAAALPLLSEAADLVRQIGIATATKMRPAADFDRRLGALRRSAPDLRPPRGVFQTGDTAILEQRSPDLTDPLYGLLGSIASNVIPRCRNERAGYRALAAHITDTVIGKELDGALSEPWQLVGINGHPPSLDNLRAALEDLHALVDELANTDADTDKIRRSALAGTSAQALRRAAATCRTATSRRQQRRHEGVQAACRATGLRTNVFDSAHSSTTTIEYRISVELDSLLDWSDALDKLVAALQPNQPAGERYLFVPLRHNRPVPGLTMILMSSLWPEPNPDGLDKLLEPHSSDLADTFAQALNALATLSGISCLPDRQQDDEKIQAVAETAESEFMTAWETLSRLPDDPVITALCLTIEELTVRIRAEYDGISTELNFAAQFTPLGHDEVTNELQMIAHANCFALESNINPQAATELFLSTTG